jgi:NAD(P)-dependent dehydrogenase (short-subunit alcohol dehydrogenase family)
LPKTVFLLGASSDIGGALMRAYLDEGHTVVGTHRRAGALSEFVGHPRAIVLQIDLDAPTASQIAVQALAERELVWDVFIAANGTMEPIGPFMGIDGLDWQNTIVSNSIAPCRVLQALYRLRNTAGDCAAVFMAGGGTNNAFANYSAYCLSKILLIKMCELLDDEVPDLKTFIVGPGYVRTKIHEETFRAGRNAGANLKKTMDFLENEGTPMQDIKACIDWCLTQRREAIGGRNVSVVHDPWRTGGEALVEQLLADSSKYKLRRHGNAAPPASPHSKTGK